MQQRALKWMSALIYGSVAVGGAWLALHFLLPWLAPFIVAFSAAAIMEGAVRFLIRHRWRRGPASAVLTLMVLGLLCALLVRLTTKGVSTVSRFASQAPVLMERAAEVMEGIERRVLIYIAAAPEGVSDYLATAISALGDSLYRVPAMLSQWALDFVSRAAQASPDILLFIVTAGLGSYFISASYPRITAFLRAQLPRGFLRRLDGMGQNLRAGFGGMLRAQLILMAMTFALLTLSFYMMGVKSAVSLAAITAAVDALPVFGTGIVLLPWAAYCLLLGETRRGIGLLVCYLGVTLLRSVAQAKLLGDQIGLDPIASLLSVYVGWKVWGFGGMLLFPVLFVALRQLNDRGIVHLWNSE